MEPLVARLDEVRPLFLEQATGFTASCRGLSDLDLLDPSSCRGWSRLDLLVHVRSGLDEMAAGAGARTSRPPDHDAASYWASDPDDRADDPVPHLMWLRRTASAYSRPAAAVMHLAASSRRACAVVESAPDGVVLFQGKAMLLADFIATWVVELAVHELDLDASAAPPGAALARRTLEALAGAPLPDALSDSEAVRVGLGRSAWPSRIQQPRAFPVSL